MGKTAGCPLIKTHCGVMHEEGRVEKRETRTFSVMKVRAERSSKQTWMSRLDFLWQVESSVKSITATK